MNTNKYLFILLFYLMGLGVYAQDINDNRLNFYYLGFKYYVHPGGYYNFISFELTNESNDTLYILKSNISISVYKKGKKIEETKVLSNDHVIACPFYYFGNTIGWKNYPDYKKDLDSLSYMYVKRLFIEKYGIDKYNHIDGKKVVDDISREIIVLMPHTSVNHDIVFYSEEFDKSCRVYATYQDKDIFSGFLPK